MIFLGSFEDGFKLVSVLVAKFLIGFFLLKIFWFYCLFLGSSEFVCDGWLKFIVGCWWFCAEFSRHLRRSSGGCGCAV